MPCNIDDVPNNDVGGRVEAVVVCGGEAEQREAGVLECGNVRDCSAVLRSGAAGAEEIREREFSSFDPMHDLSTWGRGTVEERR